MKASGSQKQTSTLKENEKDVTKQVLDWVSYDPEITLLRFNTTGIPDKSVKGGLRKNPVAGAPDFIGVYMMAKIPISFYFEIKSPTGKQRDAQKKFEQAVKVQGHHYFIIRSAQDAEEAIRKIHKQHRGRIGWAFLGIKDPYSTTWLSRETRGKKTPVPKVLPTDPKNEASSLEDRIS